MHPPGFQGDGSRDLGGRKGGLGLVPPPQDPIGTGKVLQALLARNALLLLNQMDGESGRKKNVVFAKLEKFLVVV